MKAWFRCCQDSDPSPGPGPVSGCDVSSRPRVACSKVRAAMLLVLVLKLLLRLGICHGCQARRSHTGRERLITDAVTTVAIWC